MSRCIRKHVDDADLNLEKNLKHAQQNLIVISYCLIVDNKKLHEPLKKVKTIIRAKLEAVTAWTSCRGTMQTL